MNPGVAGLHVSGSGSHADEAVSSEGLTRAGGSTSKTASCWLLAGGLRSSPHRPLLVLLEGPHRVTAGSPSDRQPQTQLGGSSSTSSLTSSQKSLSYRLHILRVRSETLSAALTQGKKGRAPAFEGNARKPPQKKEREK